MNLSTLTPLDRDARRLMRLWPRVQGDHAAEQCLRRRLARESCPAMARILRSAVVFAAVAREVVR